MSWELWIGSNVAKDKAGITRAEWNRSTGEWHISEEYGGIDNPSFLCTNRAGTRLYAVSSTAEHDGAEGGQVASFPIDAAGRKLGPGQFWPTHGAGPCHLSLTPQEDWLAVANYSGASATMYPILAEGKPGAPGIRFRHTGSGPDAARQEEPHPHSCFFSPDGRDLLVCDLGIDKVVVYTRGPQAHEWTARDAAALAPGAGPRHLAFHPSGRELYVLNELANTIDRFAWLPDEPPAHRQTIGTLPSSFSGESWCAEIVVSPDGRFVYASNRGHDSIAVFAVDPEDGSLQPAGHVSTRGRWPRNFALTPDGAWLAAANQHSDNVVLFRVDAASGLPVYAGAELSVAAPTCVHIRGL